MMEMLIMGGSYTSLPKLRSVTIFRQLQMSYGGSLHHRWTNGQMDKCCKSRFIVLLIVRLKTTMEKTLKT